MCGIFGIFSENDNACKKVVKGLKKLEYRGYDSWGIAWKEENKINKIKKVGKISESEEKDFLNLKSRIAIGHSRWATHGKVSVQNAHPHFSMDGKISIVHNGVIENFAELRKNLEKKGYKFTTETDSECIVHLLSENISKGLKQSFLEVFKKIEGRFAVVGISQGEEKIIGMRRGSPLILGVGKNEHFLASDIPAFLSDTNKVKYIDDEELVEITEKKAQFFNARTRKQIEKRLVEVKWEPESVDKGKYKHFMIKEIWEQKETIFRSINQNEEDIKKIAKILRRGRGIFLIGCGTAGKVCGVGEYFLSQIPKIHVNPVVGSEFGFYKDFLEPKNLVIAVSQSGETADVIEALEIAKAKKVNILALTNVESSTVARLSDVCFKINAGPEKAVASTKAATAQMAILLLIAFAADSNLKEGKRVLIETSSKINDMLNPRYEEYIKNQAKKIFKQENMYIIGKGPNFPIALESAIKIQEVSYIHAEGFAAGELKHGPIALVSNGVPCIILGDSDKQIQKEVISNAQELKTRGGKIIGISPENNDVYDIWIRVPDCGLAQPIVNLIPIQILAYHLAVLRNLDPDMPRNLAKSVTVK